MKLELRGRRAGGAPQEGQDPDNKLTVCEGNVNRTLPLSPVMSSRPDALQAKIEEASTRGALRNDATPVCADEGGEGRGHQTVIV